MKRALAITLLIALARPCLDAAPVSYTYDAQRRLVQASYSATQKEFYNYDAAGNVDQHVVITDAKYLESWLLYFSLVEPWTPGATVLRDAVTAALPRVKG